MYQGNQSLEFIITERHISLEIWLVYEEFGKIGQEVMCYSRSSNYSFMDFVVYEKCASTKMEIR